MAVQIHGSEIDRDGAIPHRDVCFSNIAHRMDRCGINQNVDPSILRDHLCNGAAHKCFLGSITLKTFDTIYNRRDLCCGTSDTVIMADDYDLSTAPRQQFGGA